MKTGQTVASFVGVLVIAAMGILLWRNYNERLSLEEKTRQLRASLAAMESERTNPTSGPAEAALATSPELMRLRGEVAQLRRQTNEMKALEAENTKLKSAVASATRPAAAQPQAKPVGDNATTQPLLVPRETWAFAGYASPEDTLKTAVWAMSNGDPNSFLAALSPTERANMERQWQGKTEEQIGAESRREMEKLTGFRILDRQVVSDDEVVLRVFAEGDEGDVRKMRMKRFGSDWKFDGVAKDRRRESIPQ
jgi:hypothetical protein